MYEYLYQDTFHNVLTCTQMLMFTILIFIDSLFPYLFTYKGKLVQSKRSYGPKIYLSLGLGLLLVSSAVYPMPEVSLVEFEERTQWSHVSSA